MTDDPTRHDRATADRRRRARRPTATGRASTRRRRPAVAAGARGAHRARWAIGLRRRGTRHRRRSIAARSSLLGSQPTPEALTYIPADAALVVELRPDLPGDQIQKLGNLLAHFPGFADQSTLTDQDRRGASRSSSAGPAAASVDYRTDIKPWLSGPAFVGAPADVGRHRRRARCRLHGVASLTTNGTVDVRRDLRGPDGHARDVPRPASSSSARRRRRPASSTARQALLGDPASVRRPRSTPRPTAPASTRAPRYQAARDVAQGDQLATIYLSGAGYLAMLEAMAALTPGMPDDAAASPAAFPEWMIAGVRAEDDALVLDVVVAPPAAPRPARARVRRSCRSRRPTPARILPFAPANTLVLRRGPGHRRRRSRTRSRSSAAIPMLRADARDAGRGRRRRRAGRLDRGCRRRSSSTATPA